MRHRYPFDALHWLRHKRVEERAEVARESAKQTAQARAIEVRAAAERAEHEHERQGVAAAEHARLSDGLVRAGELEQVDAWRKAADEALSSKVEGERRARLSRVEHVEAEQRARLDLGAASNRAKLIDTHRTAFRASCAAAQEAAEEDAAAEQWAARNHPARRG